MYDDVENIIVWNELLQEGVQFPANEKLGKRRMQDFAGPAVDKIFTKKAMKVTKKS